MKLDIRPIASITSVQYYDANGTLQTVSASDYWFDRYARRSRPDIVFKDSFGWPVLEAGRPSAVQVTFVAGYADADHVPVTLKLAIKQLASFWYNQRESAATPNSVEPGDETSPGYREIPFGVYSIVRTYNASGYT